mmetsp:Transcript_58546/g.174337  ORF Transcript_58546/g.174337 Transcript_58546/m.174337 type:complete len:200 (-) Transcript_58546:417-1016(-)
MPSPSTTSALTTALPATSLLSTSTNLLSYPLPRNNQPFQTPTSLHGSGATERSPTITRSSGSNASSSKIRMASTASPNSETAPELASCWGRTFLTFHVTGFPLNRTPPSSPAGKSPPSIPASSPASNPSLRPSFPPSTLPVQPRHPLRPPLIPPSLTAPSGAAATRRSTMVSGTSRPLTRLTLTSANASVPTAIPVQSR